MRGSRTMTYVKILVLSKQKKHLSSCQNPATAIRCLYFNNKNIENNQTFLLILSAICSTNTEEQTDSI